MLTKYNTNVEVRSLSITSEEPMKSLTQLDQAPLNDYNGSNFDWIGAISARDADFVSILAIE